MQHEIQSFEQWKQQLDLELALKREEERLYMQRVAQRHLREYRREVWIRRIVGWLIVVCIGLLIARWILK